MKLSLYDWCVQNCRQDILDRFDYDKNNYDPHDISVYSKEDLYLKCPDGFHESCKYKIAALGYDNGKLECKKCNTFYHWCFVHDRMDLINRWDYDKNDKSPDQVGAYSKKAYYFKCERGQHPSTPYKIANIVSHWDNAEVGCVYCNSFAQWGIGNVCSDFLEKYWDYDKNQGIDPWLLPKAARQIIWIKCQETDYHGSYDIRANTFYMGQRCGYCNRSRIHPQDSFAAYNIRRLGNDFLEKYWDYDKNNIDPYAISSFSDSNKVWIKCQDVDYHGSYETRAHDFSAGKSHCSYCHMRKVHVLDSLGTKHPEVFNVWSDKNHISPYEIASGSSKKMYFKCNCGKHKDYLEYVQRVVDREFECVQCRIENTQSHLQTKVNKYLKSLDYTYYNEYDCSLLGVNPRTGYRLPYDTEVIIDNANRLIIEVMGIQHYEVCNWHKLTADKKGTTPEEELKYIQWKDDIKRQYALSQSYAYLAIPYWTEKDHSYKSLIDSKIHEILSKAQQND